MQSPRSIAGCICRGEVGKFALLGAPLAVGALGVDVHVDASAAADELARALADKPPVAVPASLSLLHSSSMPSSASCSRALHRRAGA